MLGCYVIMYILIYLPDLETHVTQVRAVLCCLLDNHLYVKVEKCEFHVHQVKFLGYIISAWVALDTDKVFCCGDLALASFISFADFYHWFSSLATPLISLLKHTPKRLVCNSAAAFIHLKQAFTKAPFLKHPDPSKPFEGASYPGMGPFYLSDSERSPSSIPWPSFHVNSTSLSTTMMWEIRSC